MKILATISLIVISILCHSQDYNFKPKWTKGDVKNITIEIVEREIEDDELISDTTIFNDSKVTVLKDNRESYTIEVLMENQALRVAMELYNKLDQKLKATRI